MRFRHLEKEFDQAWAKLRIEQSARRDLHLMLKDERRRENPLPALQKRVSALLANMRGSGLTPEALARDRAELRKLLADARALRSQMDALAKRCGVDDRKQTAPSTPSIQ